MNAYILKKISPLQLHILDNMLQLYAHDINKYFQYPVRMDDNGRYRVRSAEKNLSDGWGYFIMVSCEYAGFVLLNHKTKAQEGAFISEFFLLPRYRKGSFFKTVIATLFSTLEGTVEYRILKKNKRALAVFVDLAKRFIKDYQTVDEQEYGEEYHRFTFDMANITYDVTKYKTHVK